MRKFTGWGYSILSRFFLGVRDPQSGLKVFRKSVLETVGEIEDDGFEWDSVFITRAKRAGLKIFDHPIVFIDKQKESNVNVIRTVWPMWSNLMQLALRLK